MPVDRQNSPETNDVIEHALQQTASCLWRKMEVRRIEQSGIHYMHGQLQKFFDLERLKNLSGAGAVTDRLIVTDSGVVGKTGSFEGHRRLFVKKQPMHSDAEFRLACQR